MTNRSATAPTVPAASDDFTYAMEVRAPVAQVIEAVTDETVISRWWTAVSRSARDGGEVQLFMGGAAPAVVVTIEQGAATGDVIWTVQDCPVMADWVGTRPSFSVREGAGGTSTVGFRHVGLRPALECFDQCRAGWSHFMPSLRQFLETGEGRQNHPRDTAVSA